MCQYLNDSLLFCFQLQVHGFVGHGQGAHVRGASGLGGEQESVERGHATGQLLMTAVA